MSQGKLVHQIGGGVIVDVFFAAIVRAVSLALSVAVARTLTKADYGAVSLALAVFGITEALSDLSLGTALVRRPDYSRELADVAWTIGAIRAVLLTSLLFFGAPLVGRMLGHAEVVPHLRILAFSAAATGLANMHVARFQRDLQFARAFLIENSRLVFGSGIGLALLVVTREPASLVIGPVAGNALTSVLTWVLVSPRPRVRFSGTDSRELIAFGRWLMGQNIFLYLFSTLDNLYVGRYLGLAAVGAYAFAWRIVNTLMTFLTRSMSRMLIPTYASMQTDLPRLIATARTALSMGACSGALMGGILLLGAEDLFRVLGGDDTWSDAVPVARALTLFTFSRIITGAVGSLLLAVNEPRLVTISSGVQVMLLVPALFIGSKLGGLTGVAVAVSLTSSLRMLALCIEVQRRFGFRVVDQALAVLPAFVVAAPVFAIGTQLTWLPWHPLLRLSCTAAWMSLGFVLLWELGRRRLGRQWPPLAAPIFDVVTAGFARVRRRLGRT